MDFHWVLLRVTWVGVFFSGMAAVAVAAQLARPHCPDRCGDVEVPFPFGITKACSLNESFQLDCDRSSGQLRAGNLIVTNISLRGQLDILMRTSQQCFGKSGLLQYNYISYLTNRTSQVFTLSNTHNVFVAVGCDTYAYFYGFRDNIRLPTGCMSFCEDISNVPNGSCSGIGCCQVEIPRGLKTFTLRAYSFGNHSAIWSFNPCSYAFIVKIDRFNFSSDYLRSLQYNETLPMVLNWAIGEKICGPNSEGYITEDGHGYRCRCRDGYDGNPYLPDGCNDIDECNDNSNRCVSNSTCSNNEGSFTCHCNDGYEGNGKRAGSGCTLKQQSKKQSNSVTRVALGFSISCVVLFVCSSWLYVVVKQRKLIKLRERFFHQNGGLILNQRLSQQENSTEATKIFSAEELKKATNNYNENLIIGEGGFGIVYKGFLLDNRVVAIKKSKVVDQNQINQFINEVIVLSHINHRNVVKLLGCCLETETPLLVYEFVSNGTLFQHIHQESEGYALSWETRLRITTETAEALSYLHSIASPPIIHRDIKSSNILLDGCYTTKVSDFGASRLVLLDQTHVATIVQGTFGYLDPEYFHTSQLTDKSDVYSFGVVLIELLTGEKALSFERPEEERSLAMYFLSSLEEDKLFGVLEKQIMNEGNAEQMKEVANLAKRCLRVKGEDRPTMKEVAMELDSLRSIEKYLCINSSVEETEYLLGETFTSHMNDVANNGAIGYDSVRNQTLFAFDDGR